MYFDNSRNYQAAVLATKTEHPQVLQSIKDGAVLFMPFTQLPAHLRTAEVLFDDFYQLIHSIWQSVPFAVDGVIFEVTDSSVKTFMGATQHHHRWQIAFKMNTEKAQVTVLAVHPQTSRLGRINPVVEIVPTALSGVIIRHVSAHHYGNVRERQIGKNSCLEIVRSGMVIPKIEAVLQSSTAEIPSYCPSCQWSVEWQNDFLVCTNSYRCPAQAQGRIIHFFHTLGNIDGLGHRTVDKLNRCGINDIISIYNLSKSQLMAFGFGDKTAQNLLDELQRSRLQPLQDWRFLAAFGLPRLGSGHSTVLLQHYSLMDIFNLTIEQIVAIDGFALKTAEGLVKELPAIQPYFKAVYNLGFNLLHTPRIDKDNSIRSPVSGQHLVFSGKLSRPRQVMEAQARQLGAKVSNAVSRRTDWLITGDKVGAKKLKDASDKQVEIIDETTYLQRINASILSD